MDHAPVLIITATFNGAAFIEDAIRSVQQQTHSHWTLVVADDGSTDATPEIVTRLQAAYPRIRLLRLARNSGRPAVPRNCALDHALGERIPFDFLAYLDSDDAWLPTKLETHLRILLAQPAVGLVYARCIRHVGSGRPRRVTRLHVRGLAGLLVFSHISLSSVVLRRASVEPFFPLFDEDTHVRAMEDTELWLRLITAGVRVHGTLEDELVYRVSPQSISHVTFSEAVRRVLYLYARILMKAPSIPFSVVALATALKVANYAVRSLREGRSRPGGRHPTLARPVGANG